MPRRLFILFPDAEHWRLAASDGATVDVRPVPTPNISDAARVAADVLTVLSSLGYHGGGVMLALPSAWCFAAAVDLTGLARRDAKALLYRLEESLPLAAEDLVADFVLPDAAGDSSALGVAVRVASLCPLVEALEAIHVPVQSAVPAAVLAAQWVSESGTTDVVEMPDGDLLALSNGLLHAWAQACDPTSHENLASDLLALQLGREPMATRLKAFGESETTSTDATIALVATCRMAAAVLEGRKRPWVELRTGALAIDDALRLHRRPLNAALAAVAMFLLVLTGGFLWRASRYAHADDAAREKLAAAYHAQYPTRAVPTEVRAILASERRKLELNATGQAATGAPASALRTLESVVVNLPKEARFALNHMSFEGASFELSGRIASYEQVDALVSSSRAAGFVVAPPETRKLPEGTWAFTLRGGSASAVAGTAGGDR